MRENLQLESPFFFVMKIIGNEQANLVFDCTIVTITVLILWFKPIGTNVIAELKHKNEIGIDIVASVNQKAN